MRGKRKKADTYEYKAHTQNTMNNIKKVYLDANRQNKNTENVIARHNNQGLG